MSTRPEIFHITLPGCRAIVIAVDAEGAILWHEGGPTSDDELREVERDIRAEKARAARRNFRVVGGPLDGS